MRIWILGTVAALLTARDCLRAQQASVMVQAIPLVTRADPTATGRTLTEGYLSQPAIMAHASWKWLRANATVNLEGLTLARGELSTGGYGESFVDRRHPHSYLHEALIGAQGSRSGFDASLFAGRGFAPFGSDDPMVRPFEKYPVNHHLAQLLERLVTVAAVRRGPILAEVAAFNGDEPTSPTAPSSIDRFGDSWSSRLTVFPLPNAELSGSYAQVKSPEVRSGHGLDQRKSSLVARYSRETVGSWRYALLEWAHTNELDRGEQVTSLSSLLGEAAYCAGGAIAAVRIERTDRPEEEPLANPFRTPRPSVDLSNLGVTRWTGVTVSLSAPAAHAGVVSGRPFVEVARMAVEPGTPAGIFNPQLRYGTNRMWMVSAGVRLHAGSMHDRMGRYGAAETGMSPRTESHGEMSDMMPGMDMSPASGTSMSHHASGRCRL